MLTIDRVAVPTGPDEEPIYSSYGHIIAADGTCYALNGQWYHGIVLALLKPELLAAYTLEDPKPVHDAAGVYVGTTDKLTIPEDRDGIDVFAFQAFEIAHNGKHDLVRFCPSRVMSPPSVDLPYDACTPQQLETLRQLLIKTMDMRLRDTVAMTHKDVTVATCLKLAAMDRESRYAVV
jgi:hypothetical protein